MLCLERVSLQFTVVTQRKERRVLHEYVGIAGEGRYGGAQPNQPGVRITQRESIIQASGEEECVIARRPFAMIAQQHVRLLFFGHAQGLAGAFLIVILGYIARLRIEITHLQKNAVLVRKLLLEAGGQIELLQIVVRSLTLFGAIKRIERVAAVAEQAVLRSALNPIAAAEIFGAGEDAQAFGGKEPGIFLLRNILRQVAAPHRGQEVRHQQLAEPRSFVTQIDQLGIAQGIIAVRQKQMGRIIAIIIIHRARSFLHAAVEHAGVTINGRQVCAAHGLVLVQQQPRAEEAAVLVQFLRILQIEDRFVDAIRLLVQQRHIEPARGIVWVEFLRQLQFLARMRQVMDVSEGFA